MRMPGKHLFLPFLVAGMPLLAGYGETVTVEIKLGTNVSPGWAITAQSYSGPRFYSPHFPTKCYMTLKNLNGAPLGAEEEVLGQSPIPAGWKIAVTRGNTGVDRLSYNIRHIIRKVTEVPVDPTATPAPATTESKEFVFDIAAIDWKRQDAEKAAAAAALKAVAKKSPEEPKDPAPGATPPSTDRSYTR